ncbi:MAG TPA: hypothetical protein VEJ16_07230 [Alphaproteobacteria bacterium]|nr:hypothetical protein [Alphaproteobacteria bacterium]
MDEIVPFVLGAVLGALIWTFTSGRMRLALSVGAVLVSGFAATMLSGEYLESWVYLLLDFGEAAIGLAIGMFIARRVQSSRASQRLRSPTETKAHR